jgi:hypothetical protein
MPFNIGTIAKAVTAAVSTFGATYATALQDGTVTTGEWVTIAVAVVVATAAVYAVPNAAQSVDTGKHAAVVAPDVIEGGG